MRSERCANQQGSPNDDGLSNTQNVRHAAYTTQSKCLQEGKDCLLWPSNNWNHLSGIKLDNTDFEDSHDAKTTLSAYMSQRDYHRQHHLISPVFLPRESRVCGAYLDAPERHQAEESAN
jgi:hypothetical protein